MNIVNVNNCQTLLLGRRGENEVTEVIFDFSDWAAEFGPGVIDLYAQRNGDAAAYPVLVTTDGTTATWIVTATDTNVAGIGRAEYVYRIDGKIAKSAIFQTCVMEDIGQPTSTPPDPYESWLEQLTALGAETEAHAQAAEQSAEDAAESAEDAAQSATSAEGYAGQAETAAGLAQAAQTASEAARDAAQTAQASAESSATAASGSAASAASSATAAAGSAYDASASASAAGASATAAGDAETQAEAAKTAAQTAQSAAEDAAEDAQQAAQQAHVEYEQLSGEVDDLSDEVAQQKSAIEDLEALTNRKAGMLVDSVSGAIASFVPDSTIDNLLGLSVDIEPVQDLHGYDSPWPAGGSAQLLPTYPEDMTRDGITLKVNEDSSVTLNGTATATTVFGAPAGTWQWDGAEDCWLSGCPAGGNFLNSYSLRIGALDSSSNYSSADAGNGVKLSPSNPSADLTDKDLRFEIVVRSGTVCTNLTFKPMLNKGLSAQPFQPYENICPISGWDAVEVNHSGADTSNPTTYTIQLGQTVYGGKLDVTNGVLTVDRAMVDLGTRNWSKQNESGFWTFYTSAVFRDAKNTAVICSDYKYPGVNNHAGLMEGEVCWFNNTDLQVTIRDTRYQDAASFKAAMSGVQLVYELATPIEIQLDPVTIAAIANQTNNVWADAGNVAVEYAADLKHYIDNKIAAAVAALS